MLLYLQLSNLLAIVQTPNITSNIYTVTTLPIINTGELVQFYESPKNSKALVEYDFFSKTAFDNTLPINSSQEKLQRCFSKSKEFHLDDQLFYQASAADVYDVNEYKELYIQEALIHEYGLNKNIFRFFLTRGHSSENVWPGRTNPKELSLSKISKDKRCNIFLYLRANDDDHKMPLLGLKGAPLIDKNRVLSRRIQKVQDICEEIDNIHAQGGIIHGLFIQAHSNPGKLSLDLDYSRSLIYRFLSFFQEDFSLNSHELTTQTIFPEKGCLHHLEPEAPIILLSCRAGGENHGEENLADAIAKQAIGHPVIAPQYAVARLHDHFQITQAENNNLHFSFWNENGDISYRAYSATKS